MKWFSLLALCALTLIFVSTIPAKNVSSEHKTKSPRNNVQSKTFSVKSNADAFKYLTRFGYNPCENPSGSNSSDYDHPSCQSDLESMLKQFQTNFGLPVTKKLDGATRKVLNTHRCSMSDFPPPLMNESYIWPANRTLKWKLDRDPFASRSLKTRKYIQQAFDDWAKHTGLTFREVSGREKADFNLAFINDGHPLNGTLCHAVYPWATSNRGQIHFNRNQQWSNIYDGVGINMRLVASHAIGHSLGLSHVFDTDALMNPLYQLIQPKKMLPKKDENRIRSLYQNKSTPSTSKAIPPTTTKESKTTENASLQIPLNATWNQQGITVAGGNDEGSSLNQFERPTGLYIDDDQTIYIADHGNQRIMEWKSGVMSGKVVAGGKGEGSRTDQLSFPTDVIVDKQTDSLIICDRWNRRVMRWPRRDGTTGETIIADIKCYGVIMDDEGFLYVSDDQKHEVSRWRVGDKNGTVVAGGNGKGDHLNQLNRPYSIIVDQDHSVYVSDSGNNRVVKWIKGAKEGIVVAGGHGGGRDLTQLDAPHGLAVDRLDTVYVVDFGNHRIMRWLQGATEGSIIIGGNRSLPLAYTLNHPKGMAFDQHGNLYVADFFNYRVQKFSIELSSDN